MILGDQRPFQDSDFIFWVEVGLLDHMVVLFLIFGGIYLLLSISAATIYIFNSHQQCSRVPISTHPHQPLSFLSLPLSCNSHSNR